ncbi:MAG: hypothetical protein JSU63_04480 [Phycisphaerales bacterium]|nr:MAG: hypothetical protein JSU63_04480 [Phycisphaerales bacterium]
MNRRSRSVRWLMVVGTASILPAFILRCDKAALQFQRGLMQGLGEDVAELLMTQVSLEEE